MLAFSARVDTGFRHAERIGGVAEVEVFGGGDALNDACHGILRPLNEGIGAGQTSIFKLRRRISVNPAICVPSS